ncbi:MAG: type II secretion system secretin GspD [Thermodesulfovibrionales bacterium]
MNLLLRAIGATVVAAVLVCGVSRVSVAAQQKKVAFNFVDVELPVIAKFVSDVTGKNFIFDETFKGQVTIIAPTEMNASDAFKLFTSVLELKGFTLTPSGVKAYKIVRSSEARQKGLIVGRVGTPVNESYIVRLIQLKYISSDEAVNFLKPMISRDGHISSFGPGNLVLMIDSGLNIEKTLSILEIVDQPSTLDAPEIVFLKYAGAEEVAKMVNEGNQPIPGQPPRPNGGMSGKAIADTRLNAVLLFGPKEVREPLKRLIALLDVPSEESQGRINVYFLENADAENVVSVLQGVIKGVEEAKAQQAGSPAARRDQGILVTADKSTNSIIVIASPAEYRNIHSIIRKLDKRKKQVYVEAMIVEASISDLLDLGTRWRIMAEKNDEPVFVTGLGVMDQSAIQSILTGLAGFSMGGVGNFLDVPVSTIGSDGTVSTQTLTVPGFSALFSFEVFDGIVNVLSTPQILTSDNEEAEIVVGQNVPFVSERQSDPARPDSTLYNIERQDVGVKLKITPQIAEGDYVILDMYQEISAVQETSTLVFISVGPTTTKRSTKTTVVVKNDQTVVIGGLMEEKIQDNVTKIPLLGDIPILGWLFKYSNKKKEKTNLFVFLTPHIIRDADDLADLTFGKDLEYARSQNMYVPNQMLVKFRADVPADERERILSERRVFVLNYVEKYDLYVLGLPPGSDIDESLKEFLSVKEVQFAEPNYQTMFGSKENFIGLSSGRGSAREN